MCNSTHDIAKPGKRNRCLLLFFCLLPFCFGARAQEPQAISEIPIERCDLLPIVRVRIDGVDMRFLLDTAATSMLNLKSFSSGRSKEIQVTSWSGTAATSAREVFLPEILFGDHRLRDLRLPAIDLSPIGNACGGKIDGILGVDLLDKMGVTIDLKRRVASISPSPANAGAAYEQMEAAMHHCTSAFESGSAAELEDCFDPEIILFALQREYRGRKEVMEYLRGRFLQYAPKLSYKMKLDDIKLFGDALWYTYDYEIVSPKEHLVGRGMSMCKKDGVRWRILNMHNSLREPESGVSGKP
jgi:hypothetical protein